MNEKIESLMYHAGLTASGSWDKMDDYDHNAIEKLIELVVHECANMVENEGRFLRYDKLAEKLKATYGKPN
jgi:hypothetical protein